MQNEQIKTIVSNTAIILIIVAAGAAGYFFLKDKLAVLSSRDSFGQVDTELSIAEVGSEITRTVALLKKLDGLVKESALIFSEPSFGSLEDFSVEIPKESLGRDNPFIPTNWKLDNLKMSATVLNGSAFQSGAKDTSTAPQPPSSAQTQTTATSTVDLFGDLSDLL
ncbi:MAG: hypothetical protein HZB10_00470 [Candidatus Yonathbacteria bacterium]|nr:hypothetical protein [Candidatus Yonathbacteria bacterium]